jgi:hypothetical protein
MGRGEKAAKGSNKRKTGEGCTEIIVGIIEGAVKSLC